VSLEYFPDNKISFNDLFDGRLERFGFTTAAEAAALIAPDGTTTIVRRTDQGHAQFPREIPVVIRNAIATEFCTDLLRWGEATSWSKVPLVWMQALSLVGSTPQWRVIACCSSILGAILSFGKASRGWN
jgi:hypothetical protein